MTIQEKKEQIEELLRIHFGFENFRKGQELVIDNILSKKSVLVIMPTGGGKSLCYQLPALVLDGVTIVVSPLISLMKDQVDNLEKIGIPATFINSSIGLGETQNRLEGVKKGFYKILYIAPERFYNIDFIRMLNEIKVALFAVDEAHCISEWGHDFRPSYVKLKDAIKMVGNPPVIALTATATPEVKKDIIKQLDLKDPEIIITGFGRPNLEFGVVRANEGQKPRYVLDVITSMPEGTGIIYVGTRARADQLLQVLLENDIEAVGYHAGMEAEDRRWVQNDFLNNKVRVIVATNAFGLGIDKRDVRFVIHYDMPGTIEAYYQEAGRAGRDGKPSMCLLLYNSRDRYLQEFFIKGDNPPPSIISEIYDTLLSYDTDTVMVTYAELGETLSDKLPDMAIGTSLKILEKEGYIFRSREKNGNAFLKITANYEEILANFSKRSQRGKDVFNKIYEKYEIELEDGFYINLEEMSDILEIKKDALVRLIRKLSGEGKIEYRPPFKGTEIRILKKVDPNDLDIDMNELQKKRKEAYAKLEKMENYVYHFGCRQKYLLEYFGDTDSKDCNKCDICVTKRY